MKSNWQILQLKVEVFKAGCIFKVKKNESLFDDDTIFTITKNGKDLDESYEQISEADVYKDCKEGEFKCNKFLLDQFMYLEPIEDPDYLRITDDVYVFELHGMIGDGCGDHCCPAAWMISESGYDDLIDFKDDIFKDVLPFIEETDASLRKFKNSIYDPDIYFHVWIPTAWFFGSNKSYNYDGGYEYDSWMEYRGIFDCNKIEGSILEKGDVNGNDKESKNNITDFGADVKRVSEGG